MFLVEVEVSRAKDDGVEDLGDERHALGAAVVVDGEDEDSLGREVRQVAEDSENLESTAWLALTLLIAPKGGMRMGAGGGGGGRGGDERSKLPSR